MMMSSMLKLIVYETVFILFLFQVAIWLIWVWLLLLARLILLEMDHYDWATIIWLRWRLLLILSNFANWAFIIDL